MKPNNSLGQQIKSNLALAMDVESSGMAWTAADLQAILLHQLDAPLRADLAAISAGLLQRFNAITGGSREHLSIAQILSERPPDLQLLHLVKDFAKQAIAQGEASLPEEIGAILYYASISSAWLNWATKIHSLSSEALKTGLSWAVSQPWISPPLKDSFQRHLDHLATETG